MARSHFAKWIRTAILAGIVYGCIGIAFAIPTSGVRIWRLAAWVVSIAVFLAHAGYEHFKLRSSVRSAALHVAIAAGLGAFLLAVGANVHSLFIASTPQHHRLLLIALVVWPLITAVPAFVVGLAIGLVLNQIPRGADKNPDNRQAWL